MQSKLGNNIFQLDGFAGQQAGVGLVPQSGVSCEDHAGRAAIRWAFGIGIVF